MNEYEKLNVEELEDLRERLQAQIEAAQVAFVVAGVVLERKRKEAQIKGEIAALEQKKNELAGQVEKPVDQVVGLKTLDLRAVFNKMMGR